MKSKKTKKSVLKQFQMKGNTYSVVIVKNDKDDPLEPLMYFISTLQDKTEILDGYRIRWHRGIPNQICFKHLKSNAASLGDHPFRRPKFSLLLDIQEFSLVSLFKMSFSTLINILKDQILALMIEFLLCPVVKCVHPECVADPYNPISSKSSASHTKAQTDITKMSIKLCLLRRFIRKSGTS